MEVRFAHAALRRLDELQADALICGYFEDERPLQGTAGLVDHRLCGRVSDLLRRGLARGGEGEMLLVPSQARFPFERLLFVGLGSRSGFDQASYRRCCATYHGVLCDLRARAVIVGLPGRHLEAIDPATAMRIFLETAAARPAAAEVTLLETPDSQRAMQPVVDELRRRRRAAEG